LEINILFKDKTIVVDNYGCFCENIQPLDPSWVSLHIKDDVAKLYTVGHFEYLNDYAFIDSWVKYNQLDKSNLYAIINKQDEQLEENIANIEKNNALDIVLKEVYTKEMEDYYAGVAKAEAAEKEMEETNRSLMDDNLNN